MGIDDTTTFENELAIARVSWKQFAIKPSRIRTSSKDSEVGWGGYATVHRATLRKRWRWWLKTPVAIKMLSVPEDQEGRRRVALAFLHELNMWAPLKHPNILAFRRFHVSKDLSEMWLVSDLATHGNLYTCLEGGGYSLDERLSWAKDTAEGLNYLHTRTRPIYHGDIKSLNVLIGANRRALICDFGMASEDGPASSTRGTTGLRLGGTTRYSSPEVFDEKSCPTISSDVWSWGCLCHEIVTSLGPYKDVVMDAQVVHCISTGVPPAAVDETDCPESARKLLRRCWRVEPEERPTMSECLSILHGISIQNYRSAIRQQSADDGNTEATLDRLEAELSEVVESLQDLRVEPSAIAMSTSGRTVGEGGYGVVVRATMTQNENTEAVAVKKLRANGGRERRLQMMIAVIRELKVSAKLDHPNILPFIGFHVAQDVNEAWLVFPFMPNGDISVFMQRWTLNDEERMKLALDTAMGLEYLHSLSISHGDIKSSNVLLTRDRRAVLCDFGLAKSMESMPTGLTTTTFNQGGTLRYESPELVLARSLRSLESDVWAWGCLLHEIFTGKPPYHWGINPGAIAKWITTDIPPAVLVERQLPSSVRRVLVFCWQSEASMRPTMKQCIGVLSGDMSQLPATADKLERGMRMILASSDLKFHKGDILGSGAHGKVYRGSMTKPGVTAATKVAVKGLPPTDPEEHERLLRGIRDSAADWDGLQHPNVLPFLGFSSNPFSDPEVLLVSPFVAGGNLSDYLKRETLSYERKMELAKGIAEGLLYLHTRDPPMYHGNLHSRNVLINDKGEAMLSDYGLVGVMDEIGIRTKSPDAAGASSRYWSPDVRRGATRGDREDVWSWGCVLREIVTGRVPYGDVADVPAAVDTPNYPPRVQNLLGLCWKKDRNLRPAISEVVAILGGEQFRYENVCNVDAYDMKFLVLSHDGASLVIVYADRVVVHSTDNGKKILNLGLASKWGVPTCVRLGRSGKHLVVGTTKGLAVWKIEADKASSPIFKSSQRVNSVDISWDDTLVASVSSDDTVRMYRLGALKDKRQIGPKNQAKVVAFSPTSDAIVVGLAGGGLQIFNTAKGAKLTTFGGNASAIHSLSFSSDGHWLVEQGEAGLRTWDTSELTKPTLKEGIHDGKVDRVSISPDSNTIALVDAEGRVYVRTNYPTESAVTREVGRVPSLPSDYSVGRRDVSVLGDGSGVAVGSEVSFPSQVRIYKFASYDSPATYRIDCTRA